MTNEERALDVFRGLAEQGDAKAQFRLGAVYEQQGNRAEAERWYRKAAAQGLAMAQDKLAPPSASNPVATADVGSRTAGLPMRSGNEALSHVQLENVLTLLGSPREKVSQQLSSLLCQSQGETIVCVKQDPCYNFQALEDSGGRVGTFLPSNGPPPESRTLKDIGDGLMDALNYMDPNVRQAKQAENKVNLANCRAHHRADSENGVDLRFAGQPVKKAILSFEGGRYSRLVIDNRGLNLEEIQKLDRYSDAIHRWLTSRLGTPKATVLRTTESWIETSCVGVSCVSTPLQNSHDRREYEWTTRHLSAQHAGNTFQFDWIQ
jgi:hypothetical protein